MNQVLHIITGLKRNGAETSLFNLVKYLPSITHHCIYLKEPNEFAKHECSRFAYITPLFPLRLLRLSRMIWSLKVTSNPDLDNHFAILGWMYHGAFIALLLARLLSRTAIIYIHHSDNTRRGLGLLTYAVFRCLPILSCRGDTILYCAEQSKRAHERFFPGKAQLIVRNCIAQDYFDAFSLKSSKFAEGTDHINILYISRWAPVKDVPTLVKSISLLKERIGLKFQFTFIGDGLSDSNTELVNLLDQYNISSQIRLAGKVPSTLPFLLDAHINVLSSISEGSPNSLLEAMAAGVPCISTDVGDCQQIIGASGWIAKSGDSYGLAQHMANAYIESQSPTAWSYRCSLANSQATSVSSSSAISKLMESIISDVTMKI